MGMFSESGLIDLLLIKPTSFDGELVKEHLDKHWASIQSSAPISELLSAMETHKLRFVCVTDKEGKAIGLTGQKGLMEYIAEHFPNQAMVQRLGGTPAMSKREGA
jgi:CBS-domain-containing membrane protein